MQACTGISTCAALTPSLREDFSPKHKDCLYIAGYIAVHHTAMASGHTSACVDMLVCTMPVCTLLSLRRKPGYTWAGKELRCSKYAGWDGYGTRPARCMGEFTIP